MKKETMVVLFALMTFFLCENLLFAQENQKKILVVHSYHKEAEWTAAVNEGIKWVLQGRADIEYEVFYMDLKRNSGDKWQVEATQKVKNIISQWNPNVLILVDDKAQELVGRFYVGRKDLSIVFSGLNNSFSLYGYDNADNVTGIVETPRFLETVDFFRSINPKAKTFAVLSDYSDTSHGAISFIKNQAGEVNGEVVAFEAIATFAEWKAKVKEYEKKVDAIYVYTYGTLRAENGKGNVLSADVMKWTSQNSSVPLLGAFIFSVDNGALCGVVESALEQGEEAARIAQGLLDGQNITSYPIRKGEKTLTVLDKTQLKKFGFSVSEDFEAGIDVVLGDATIG